MRNVLLATLVIGCGGGGSSSKVIVNADKSALAAVRTGGTWKPLTLDAAGKASIAIDDAAQIVTVCDQPGYFNYYTIYTGPGDQDELQMYCSGVETASIEVQAVAPSTTQVFIDLSTAFGGDSLMVRPGVRDIVAIDKSMNPPRFEIRRDVNITANMTVMFDLAATGTPMVKLPLEITGAGSETPSRFVTYRTANRTIAYYSVLSTAADVFVVPTVGANDVHHISVSTSDELLGSRRARARITGTAAVSLALPPYLTSVTATWGVAPAIAWQGDARYESQYFYIADASFEKLYDAYVRPEWHAAGGDAKVEIPDPAAIPGWQAAWSLPAVGTGFEWSFDASDNIADASFSASKSGSF